MSRKIVRNTSVSAAMLLATMAYAQPTLTEDFGTLVNGTLVSRSVSVGPSQILWYKLNLPVAIAAGTNVDYLDIRTHGAGGTITDTEIALYDSVGNFASGAAGTSTDDDDGPGLGSALSYGATCPVRRNDDAPNLSGAFGNGRDGGLPAGDYYLAVVRFNSTFATPWAPTVPTTGTTGPMTLEVDFATSPALEAPIFTAGAGAPTNPSAGANVLLTATLNPHCSGASVSAVTIDLSAIGGSSTQQMFDDGTNGDVTPGNNVYSYAYTVPGATAPGAYSLLATVTNSNSLTDTRSIPLTVLGPPAVLTPDGGGVYTEIEDNDNKSRANIITNMVNGQSITGTSTGTSTLTAGNGSSDNFRIKTEPAALGIYLHQMSLNSATNSHTGTLRGLSQTSRVPNLGSDAVVQTSSTTSSPARTNKWYGFGKSEEVIYRVTGTSSTIEPYTASYSRTPVTTVDAGQFFEGNITIDRGGHTSDTDFIVFDSNLDPIPGYANDNPNALTRSFAPGTYYIAWSNANTANDQPAPADDTVTSANLMDFPNVVANSSTTTFANLGVRFTDVMNTPTTIAAAKSAFFDVVWIEFDVVPLTSPTNPVGSGSATPSSAQITGNVLLTVSVTPGLNPPSSAITVVGNLSSINGSSTQTFFDNGTNGDVTAGDNIFSYSATLTEPLTAGPASVPFTVADGEARSSNGAINFTLTAAPTGGCCIAGACSVTSQYNCVTGGGTYNGNGTDCGAVNYTMSDGGGTFSSISGTGTLLTTVSNCDDCSQLITLPFAFNMYENAYTECRVISNGNVQFGTSNSTTFTNSAIPSTGTPNNALYPLWDDFDTSDTTGFGQGDIYTQEVGTAPNRQFIIEWNNVTQYRQGGVFGATSENFQVVLFEGTNNVEFRYGAISPINTTNTGQGTGIDASGGDATIGIENAAGTSAVSIPSNGFTGTTQTITYSNANPCAPVCGTADFDGDGDTGTDADIEAFFACLAGNCCATCYEGGADFNADGDTGTDADIESFFRVLAGGPC
jgi:hypothetical protein